MKSQALQDAVPEKGLMNMRSSVSRLLFLCVSAAFCAAQAVTTVVGPGAVASYNTVPISNQFQNPVALATDATGALFIISTPFPNLDGVVLQLQPNGSLLLRSIVGVATHFAIDAVGNLHLTSQSGRCVTRNFSRFAAACIQAGDPPFVSSGDGGPASAAQLSDPQALAADSKGNVFIWERVGSQLRRVGPDGIIRTVLHAPISVFQMAVGPDDQLYASDSFDMYRLDGSSFTHLFSFPEDTRLGAFAIDSQGNFYVDDCSICEGGPTITRISTGGLRTRVAGGNGVFQNIITALAFDRNGNLFVAAAPRSFDGLFFGQDDAKPRIYKVANVGRALPACTFSLTPTSIAAPASGGTISVAVDVDATCGWTVRVGASTGSLLTIADGGAPFYSGPALLTLSVKPNTGAARFLEFFIGTRSYLIQQAGASTTNPPPVISSGGVVDAAAYLGTLSNWGWSSIFGTNLASQTLTWDAAIVNGKLPASLGGTTVTVNGQPAYLSYASPSQVNFLVPPVFTRTTENATVELRTANGTITYAATGSVNTAQLFGYGEGTQQRPWAYLNGGNTLAAPPGAVAGLTSRPARGGDTLTIYFTGGVATSPLATPGEINAAPLVCAAGGPQILLDTARVTSDYCGMIGPGVFQINFRLPAFSSEKDVSLKLETGSASNGARLLRVAP
jgi:uncharacterized protein (TIGR03437 family)